MFPSARHLEKVDRLLSSRGSLGNPSADCDVPENKDLSTQTEPELNNSLISFESPDVCVKRRFW